MQSDAQGTAKPISPKKRSRCVVLRRRSKLKLEKLFWRMEVPLNAQFADTRQSDEKRDSPKSSIKSGVPWERMRENSPRESDFRSPVSFLIYTKKKCLFFVA